MLNYPLTIPGVIGPSEANLKMMDAVGEVISPFDGSAQQQQWQDQHWELDLAWPEMNWTQFAPLHAFAGALHGKLGSFLWGPPLSRNPQGAGSGILRPSCLGDPTGSNLLRTQGWVPNQAGVLLPGDFLELDVLVPGTQSYAFNQIARTGSVVIAYFSPSSPIASQTGQPVYVQNTGSSFDGGPFTIVEVVTIRVGTTITALAAAWIQAGPVASYGAGVATSAQAMKRLYQYVNSSPLNPDGGGNATLDIFPSLREAPLAMAPLILVSPQGTFRLAENRREAPVKRNKMFTFQMKCREAI